MFTFNIQITRCDICGRGFPSNLAKRRHNATCITTCCQCRICAAILPNIQTLNNHEALCKRRKDEQEHQNMILREQQIHQRLHSQQMNSIFDHSQSSNRDIHHEEQNIHSFPERLNCGKCRKSFPNIKSFQKHRESHYNREKGIFKCPTCNLICGSQRSLRQHAVTEHSINQHNSCNTIHCHDCEETFETWHELHNHRIIHRNPIHSRVADPNIAMPWEKHSNVDPPWITTDQHGKKSTDIEFKKIYRDNRDTIHAGHDMGNIRAVYNFPTNDFNGETETVRPHLDQILANEQHSFKINLAFGLILRHLDTGEYRYYTAYYNNTILDLPYRIDNVHDINSLISELDGMELLDLIMRTRESTKWQKIFISNITYFVYRMGSPIGTNKNRADKKIPEFIRKRKCIVSLDISRNHSKPYKDNLCAFRCLAYTSGGYKTIERRTKQYYNTWKRYQDDLGVTDIPNNARRFKGIYLEQLPDFEQCFGVRICVYSMNEDMSCTRRYQSSLLSDAADVEFCMYLNLHQNHFSIISNFKRYARKYSCRFCRRTTKCIQNLTRHEKSCCIRVKYTFPGGIYTPALSIFEELEQTLGISIEAELQYYPWFAVYDFEAVLQQNSSQQVMTDQGMQQEENIPNTQWTTTHIPVCVSVSSNVEGFNAPKSFVDEDSDNLVKRMCDYLEKIQNHTSILAHAHWESVTKKLLECKNEFPLSEISADNIPTVSQNHNIYVPEQFDSDDESVFSDSEEETDTLEEDEEEEIGGMDFESARNEHSLRVDSLSKKFEKYMNVLPVLGYNSSKYDLNLIKNFFPKHLKLATECDYVVKKTNQYTTIATNQFKLLDITNYLAGGCSYSKFLKAYNVEESKSYFPYEWFNDVSKLKYEHLPPYEAFYSKLKNGNVLQLEYDEWMSTGAQGKNPPKNGVQKYQELLDVWSSHNMSRFEDFLQYYANLDTGPFVKGVEKLQKYYFDMGVDVFKVAISAPGVARRILFKHAKENNKHFASFSKEQNDLFYKIKTCAFGGPSIVFKRYSKVDETFVRNNPEKPCKNIAGYDCNGLYLWALGENLPVLFPIRRFKETNFKPEVSWKHIEMYQWMNWLMKEEGIFIQHKMNSPKEFPVGPYKLDGFCVGKNGKPRGFEFHGCWTHGHDPKICKFNKDFLGNPKTSVSEKTKQNQSKKNQATAEREKYIRSRKIELTVIYECEFAQQKKDNPALKHSCNELLPQFYIEYPHQISEKTILKNIMNGELTGLVQVDIEVPEKWPEGKEQDISPYEYFSEMSPIFCNSKVHFDVWGSTMQSYTLSKKSGDFSESRKLLVGGMAATKIFLATNLLQWYLEKGLKVTNIYEVVEYKFERCFEGFCDFISNARRDGDIEPAKEVLGETCKVLGNASYGSLLLDKTKHTNVTYVHDSNNAHLAVNDPLFKKVCSLPGDIFEIEKSKKNVSLDIPIQLAFCILQSAKLKLLQFYYDCLDYYVNREDFQLTHSDTDSLYFEMSGKHLIDIVKPEKKKEFKNYIYGKCFDFDEEGNPFRASDKIFFPRECCAKHNLYDKRERGLYKKEAEGDEVICLAPKTYHLHREGLQDCVKAKGINKSVLVDPRKLYLAALQDREAGYANNIGFRAINNTIMTYSQKRKGFTFDYTKREVLPNGIDTKPLTLNLNPWEDYNVHVLKQEKDCLSNDYQCAMFKHGRVFRCCTQLYFYEFAVFHGNRSIAADIGKATNMSKIISLARQIKINQQWFIVRDKVMYDIIWQKIIKMKYRIISELKEYTGVILVQPGCAFNQHFTCGLPVKMAEITDPKNFPGDDIMSSFWEQLSSDLDFMNS